LFVLCAREIQKSIAESVYRLLVDQIVLLGLESKYDIQATTIISRETGSQFVFAGVRNNVTSIKSMEGIDVCLVEEATLVSESSWTVLLPTVRRDPPHGPFGQGSETWVIFNPELASDYTYRFWVTNPPVGTVLVSMSWRDNPWFPDVLKKQMDDMRERDYESYLTIWEGQVRRVLKGAIYAKQLEKAQEDGRISRDVVVDRSRPVDVGVDLGRSDMTAMWFFQQRGTEHHAVDYYGNFGEDWSHYLDQVQGRKYLVGKIYLPHDAANKVVHAKKSIEDQTRSAYPGEGRVRVVPRTPSVASDINAVRSMFSRMRFSESACADGLTALAHYQYEVDPETREVSKYPLHNWASNPADALRTYVMGVREFASPKKQDAAPRGKVSYPGSQNWMGNA
jgi:phage terminase large subunit